MNIYFINPPFKAEYGKFSRESRSPAITKSGALYYPLWLIYAALYSRKQGHIVSFLDAPAKQLNEEQSLDIIEKTNNEHSLFVLDTSTPSIKNDVAFAGKLKAIYPHFLSYWWVLILRPVRKRRWVIRMRWMRSLLGNMIVS